MQRPSKSMGAFDARFQCGGCTAFGTTVFGGMCVIAAEPEPVPWRQTSSLWKQLYLQPAFFDAHMVAAILARRQHLVAVVGVGTTAIGLADAPPANPTLMAKQTPAHSKKRVPIFISPEIRRSGLDRFPSLQNRHPIRHFNAEAAPLLALWRSERVLSQGSLSQSRCACGRIRRLGSKVSYTNYIWGHFDKCSPLCMLLTRPHSRPGRDGRAARLVWLMLPRPIRR